MKKTAKVKSKKRRVRFSLDALHAQQVSLVGDFNAWDPKKHPMKKNVGGLWEKTVILDPGTHEYKFFMDDQWIIWTPATTGNAPIASAPATA